MQGGLAVRVAAARLLLAPTAPQRSEPAAVSAAAVFSAAAGGTPAARSVSRDSNGGMQGVAQLAPRPAEAGRRAGAGSPAAKAAVQQPLGRAPVSSAQSASSAAATSLAAACQAASSPLMAPSAFGRRQVLAPAVGSRPSHELPPGLTDDEAALPPAPGVGQLPAATASAAAAPGSGAGPSHESGYGGEGEWLDPDVHLNSRQRREMKAKLAAAGGKKSAEAVGLNRLVRIDQANAQRKKAGLVVKPPIHTPAHVISVCAAWHFTEVGACAVTCAWPSYQCSIHGCTSCRGTYQNGA